MPKVRASSGMMGTTRFPIPGSRTRLRTKRLKAMVVLAGRSDPLKSSSKTAGWGSGIDDGCTFRSGRKPPSWARRSSMYWISGASRPGW